MLLNACLFKELETNLDILFHKTDLDMLKFCPDDRKEPLWRRGKRICLLNRGSWVRSPSRA